MTKIYNSRNYLGLIDGYVGSDDAISTTVEII